jgi:hypothetical protein
MEIKIEPWLFWVWNEQTFFFESTNYALDDAIEQGSQFCLIGCVYTMKFGFA